VFVFWFWKSSLCVSEFYWGSLEDSAVSILLKFDWLQNRETTLGNLGLKGYASVASMLLQYTNCSSIMKIWLQVVVSLLLRQTMPVMQYLQVNLLFSLLPLLNRPLEIHNQKYLFVRYLVCSHYLGCVSGYVLGQFSFRYNWNDSLSCMILVSVVESTSTVSYIMVYIPTFILCACLFVCLQEMWSAWGTKGELWFVKEYCAKWQM
jgi:hypothetical protein